MLLRPGTQGRNGLMQINDLFGRAAAFETARLPDGTAAVLPAEHAAALYVNEQPAFRVVCTPELLPQLALGRLLTEGWITSAQEVEQAAVCAEGLKVNVYLNHRLPPAPAAGPPSEPCPPAGKPAHSRMRPAGPLFFHSVPWPCPPCRIDPASILSHPLAAAQVFCAVTKQFWPECTGKRLTFPCRFWYNIFRPFIKNR